MKSMTGFGRAEKKNDSFSCTVEISSLNRKNLDIKIISETNIGELELIIRKIIAEKFLRGTITVKITLNFNDKNSTSFDDKFKELYSRLEKNRKKLKIKKEITISDIIKFYTISETLLQNTITLPDKLISSTVKQAAEKLEAMRAAEGSILKQDIENRLKQLYFILSNIEKNIENSALNRKKNLTARLNSLGLNLDLNDERILKEIAILAEKSDATEEIIRLKSHFAQFENIINSEDDAGRKLDFLTQEIFREISTLSAKSTNSLVSQLVVNFKSELEKIREQIQNIE